MKVLDSAARVSSVTALRRRQVALMKITNHFSMCWVLLLVRLVRMSMSSSDTHCLLPERKTPVLRSCFPRLSIYNAFFVKVLSLSLSPFQTPSSRFHGLTTKQTRTPELLHLSLQHPEVLTPSAPPVPKPVKDEERIFTPPHFIGFLNGMSSLIKQGVLQIIGHVLGLGSRQHTLAANMKHDHSRRRVFRLIRGYKFTLPLCVCDIPTQLSVMAFKEKGYSMTFQHPLSFFRLLYGYRLIVKHDLYTRCSF